MSAIGIVHMSAGWLSLGAGLANLLLAKGTRGHRALGYLFVFSMLLMNLVAFSLYGLTGQLNLFHALAVASLATTLAAIVPALRRRPGWMARHAARMQWAYIGLCAAAANEILTREVLHRMPSTMHGFWAVSLGISLAVIAIGDGLARRQRRAGWAAATS